MTMIEDAGGVNPAPGADLAAAADDSVLPTSVGRAARR